jgi:uroporphyrinogen-III decarboxylase
MKRDFYLDLAKSGRRMPIATHLVLHEKEDPEGTLLSASRMAAVMAETAKRFASPLALPVMDLTLEKDFMLRAMGIGAAEAAAYHFDEAPSVAQRAALESADPLSSARIAANCGALRILAGEREAGSGLLPVGMSIGPFSLLSKMLHDPIVPIFLAGSGVEAGDSEEVALLQALLPLCESAVARCVSAQIDAGAAAIFVCEPAANSVFFSPKQIEEGGTAFDEYVIEPNKRLKKLLDSRGVDLLFHDCGSLTTGMVASFAVLDPAIFSFGSPVNLWEVESFVPKTTVIYGNLPTKKFYSDEEVPLSSLPKMVGDIEARLRASGHPFIVGSECDVLSMEGYEGKIMEKVKAFCSC